MKDNLTQSIFNIKADVEENITFAFVSDLHDRTNEPMLKIFEDNCIDAVLVGGDFVHNGKKYERGLEFLKLSSERYPTFVEIGNHETKSGLDMVRLVKKSGATLLDDTFTEYKGVIIGGLTTGFGFGQKQSAFMRTPEPHLGWLKEFQAQKGYRILLNHHPEYYTCLLYQTVWSVLQMTCHHPALSMLLQVKDKPLTSSQQQTLKEHQLLCTPEIILHQIQA